MVEKWKLVCVGSRKLGCGRIEKMESGKLEDARNVS